MSLKDALYIMLVKSANDMAVAIAETIGGDEKTFVAQMNLMASRWDCRRDALRQRQRPQEPSQISSARDLAMLALYVQRDYPQYAADLPHPGGAARRRTRSRPATACSSTSRASTGMKTGYICQSGLNIVATVERDGRSLLAVVLGASSARERNELAAQLFLARAVGRADADRADGRRGRQSR